MVPRRVAVLSCRKSLQQETQRGDIFNTDRYLRLLEDSPEVDRVLLPFYLEKQSKKGFPMQGTYTQA
jgi:hypothetical protein